MLFVGICRIYHLTISATETRADTQLGALTRVVRLAVHDNLLRAAFWNSELRVDGLGPLSIEYGTYMTVEALAFRQTSSKCFNVFPFREMQLGALTRVVRLAVHDNQLDSLPASFAHLSSLQVFLPSGHHPSSCVCHLKNALSVAGFLVCRVPDSRIFLRCWSQIYHIIYMWKYVDLSNRSLPFVSLSTSFQSAIVEQPTNCFWSESPQWWSSRRLVCGCSVRKVVLAPCYSTGRRPLFYRYLICMTYSF